MSEKRYLPEGYEDQRQLIDKDTGEQEHYVVYDVNGNLLAKIPLFRPRYGAVRAFVETLPKSPIPKAGETQDDAGYYIPVESYDSAFAAVCAILPEDMSQGEQEEVFLLSGAANGDLARKAFRICTARKQRQGDGDPTI